ncbi:MAG: hypothetical protein ACR2NN_17045 [Bryobacteraceae bacterium]
MRIPLSLLLTLLLSRIAPGQTTTPDVGSGAPNGAIQIAYQQAFFRNGFSNLVSLPPLGNVKAFGGTGLVQEFADAAKSQTNKYALIKANASAPVTETGGTVFQVYAGLYSYYTTVGAPTAGFPTTDTLTCPTLVSTPGNSCIYQFFDKPYALFVYKNALANGNVNFAVRDPFYTKWQSLGGIGGAGPATSAETAITSATGIAATLQTFDQAAVFNITSGTLAGRLVGVGPTVYAAYSAAGGYSGFFGLPVADEQLQPSGVKRQTFEGGFIEYTPGGPAVVNRAIQDIVLTPGVTSLRLNLGDSIMLTATPFDSLGNALTGRPVVFTTSNSRVVAIQPAGQTVTIKAVGGGSAAVTATAEGKSSAPLSIVVSAPCCGLGEGSPTPAIQQAFQDAVARTRIPIQLPAAGPVQRAANGYIQNVQDATGTPFLIAISDRSSAAYVLSGALLAKYLELGGPSGPLGYPVSDATVTGRQLFENQTALAGNPVQLVSGSFLSKWAALGYETGPASSPTSGVSTVLSFRATTAGLQSFSHGVLVSTRTGPSAGKVYFLTGAVLAAYTQAGGATGVLGLPLDDEFASGGKRQQDFEGGTIDYSPGDPAAVVHPGSRKPLVTATPAQPIAGSRINLAIGGFDPGSTVRVSVSGQPDFTVRTDSGAYVWQASIPTTAKTGAVTIHAVDVATSASADGSYTVRSPAEVVFQVTKYSGDGQTGAPGSTLLQPLRILVKDDAGNVATGLPVTFAASPGAQIASASAVTDASGFAEAVLRLPPSDGVALATATAGRQFVTFNAQATHSALLNFPRVSQAADGGSMLASVAAILRFYQIPLADPQLLNQYLKSLCVPDSQGSQICDGFVSPPDSKDQIVNLWRLGVTVSVEKNDIATVQSLLGQGSPVLLVLALPAGGSHFVVATGVAADGSILIMDPDPADGTTLKGALAGVVRLVPGAPVSSGFLVTGNSMFNILSPVGACGMDLDIPEVPTDFHMRYCDGSQNSYELDTAGDRPFRLTLTDLGTPGNRVDLAGSGAAAFTVSRSGAQWTAAPATLNFTSAGVVNAASFTPDLAPGGLFTVFGNGLAQSDVASIAQIGGLPAPVLAQSAFQLTGAIPLDLAPGNYTLKITSPYGTLDQPVTIKPVAPALFAPILNQNGTLNTPDNPAARGQTIVLFGTGLGAAQTPVKVLLQGAELTPAFAGLAPGFIGLYQINVLVPLATAPGLNVLLTLRQDQATSNPIQVSLQ